MATLYIYRIQLPMKTPEIQFVDALMQKKVCDPYNATNQAIGLTTKKRRPLTLILQVTQLKDLDLGDHPKRDYTLYVSLPFVRFLPRRMTHRSLTRFADILSTPKTQRPIATGAASAFRAAYLSVFLRTRC